MVLGSGELGTTNYHSVYILVSDSFAFRSPLKNSFARVKKEKFQEKIVCSILIQNLEPKKICILTRRLFVWLRNQWNGFDHSVAHRNNVMEAGFPP